MVILVLSRYCFIVIPYHFPHGHYIEKILMRLMAWALITLIK